MRGTNARMFDANDANRTNYANWLDKGVEAVEGF